MKKIITKLMLVFVLMIPTISFTLSQNTVEIAAKISGDYAYEMVDEDSIQITNYNGSEIDLVIPSQIDGYSVVKIGYGAFAECKSIQKVTLPETLRTIDYYAFSQCTQLQEIQLPNSLISIGRYAFAGCHSLKQISVPEKIKSLGYGVFFDCIALEQVNLPEGMESIGGIAFGSCRSLQEIKLPSTLVSIEGNAFNDCTSLARIDLPNSVKSIGPGVFLGCLSLKEVNLPESLVGIGQNAFQNCISLESIYLPENVSGIGYGAFTGCVALKEINIPRQVNAIGNAMFSGCSSLESITIPDTVLSLGEYVFSGCTNLKEVNISDSVTTIGAATFQNCSNLKNITLPKNIKEIGTNLFRYCDKLESIVIPNGVTQVNATAFADCGALQSVTFPNSISQTVNGDPNIGSRIFSNTPNVVASVIDGSQAHKYMVRTGYQYRLLKSGMNFNSESMSIKLNDTMRLSVLLAPYTIVDNKQLKWETSNANVVQVNGDGVVSAVGVGQASISASNSNGQKATCLISVNNDVVEIVGISLNKTSTTLRLNSTETLRATINPTTTTQDRTLQWRSSNSDVVLVSSTGAISAVQPGTATISVTTSNGLSASCEVNVISEISSVSLNKTAMVLESGTQQSLRATINPSNTTDSKVVTWKSSNNSVASVDQDGNVVAVDEGYATITATSVNGKKAECKITVVKPVEMIPIESVSLNKESITLEANTKETLIATINPENTTEDKTLTWTSSDMSVASVDENGEISALSNGKTTITVTTSNQKSASCEVNVVTPISSVALNKETLTLNVDGAETLIATINPSDTSDDKTLLWTSSNPSVASVSQNGEVKALANGKTTITVTTSNQKSASCEVSVVTTIDSVTLNKTSLRLKVDTEETLIATINPENTSDDKTLTWSSSDVNVASVDQNGKVIAKTVGTTTITVKTSNNKTAACEVVVFQVNKADLKATLDLVDGLNAMEYTKDSFDVLSASKVRALTVYENDQSTQTEVDSANEHLLNTIDQLVQRATAAQLSQLATALEQCEAMESEFSTEEFAVMKKIIIDAKALLASDAQNIASSDVSALYDSMQAEKDFLVYAQAYSKLSSTIFKAQNIIDGDTSLIDPSALQHLITTTQAAQALLQNPQATSTEMGVMSATLLKAIEDAEVKVSKVALSLLVDEVKDFDANAYTEETWNVFKLAFDQANAVLADEATTQVVVDNAYNALLKAKEQLQSKTNKVALQYNIQIIEDILSNRGKYVTSTIRTLDGLLVRAKALNDKLDATQKELDAMNKTLVDALMRVRVKPN